MVTTGSSESSPLLSGTHSPRFVIGADFRYRGGYKDILDELRVWDTVMSEDVWKLYRQDAGLVG